MAKKVYKASDFRYSNILPNPLIDKVAGMKILAIRFLPDFKKFKKWWQFEDHIEIDFEDASNSAGDEIYSLCSSCGLCCKDIPTHQIGIYMSETEKKIAENNGHDIKTQGSIDVEGINFSVLDVDSEGDCSMLGPKGCTLGDLKPLWCKIYHCEKFQGEKYLFQND